MRNSHHQTVEGSIEAISAFAKKHDIETDILFHGMTGALSDTNTPAYGMITDLIESHFPGSKTRRTIMLGATDACYLSALSTCILRFSPLLVTREQRAAVHGDDENINLSSLIPAVEFYKKIIQTG